MYGNCRKCKDVCIIKVSKDIDQNEEAKWFQWVTKKETRQIKSEEKEITFTQKDEMEGKLGNLIDEFHSQLERFKIHSFNIECQMKHYQWLKENMKRNEVMVHVDFAENYECKMSTEIQTMHFGASKRQITLHTGVYRFGESEKSVSFCSVSDSLEHGPAAIWAHLEPVLNTIKRNANIDTIHFFSDGPCSQYRQKGNFQLFSHELVDHGFKFATWNYHEAGLGKGAPDGVGAALKRSADFLVLHGSDIRNASDFVLQIRNQETSVELYEVSDKEIALKFSKMTTVKTVPGTMKIHQVITACKGEICYRDISCSCLPGKEHMGHELKKVQFRLADQKEVEKQNQQDMKVGTTLEPPQKTLKTWNKKKDRKLESQEKTKQKLEPPKTEHKLEPGGKTERKLEPGGKTEHKLEPGEKTEHKLETGEKTEQMIELQDKTAIDTDRESFFEDTLRLFSSSKSFDDLKRKCQEVKEIVQGYEVGYFRASIMNAGLPVDETALALFPDDVPGDVLYPVCVRADGNCLPYAGSVIAFGNQDHATEMRVRIIAELVLNSETFLSQEFLQKGLSCTPNIDLAKSFAMYSEEYLPAENNSLGRSEIKLIFEKEIMKITKKATYMGIWQLFALASALERPIYSIYPKHGNQSVRKDLNRLILPRIEKHKTIVFIMWTSTRFDMTERNWIPNHFVPALPIEISQKSEHQEMFDLKIQRWRLMRERKLARDELKKVKTENEVVYIDDDENIQNRTNKMKETKAKIEKQTSQQLDNEQNDDKGIGYETSEKKREEEKKNKH